MSATELLQVRRARPAQHYTRQIGHAPSRELQKSLDALEGAFKSLCAEDVARVRPGRRRGAPPAPAMRSECCSRRCQSRRRPRSRVHAAELLRASESAETLGEGVRHAAVPLRVVHIRGAQRAAAQGRRARAARESASACCRLASAVSGESPDISATRALRRHGVAALAAARPTVAADSEAFAAGESRRNAEQCASHARSVAPVRRPPWPAGALLVVSRSPREPSPLRNKFEAKLLTGRAHVVSGVSADRALGAARARSGRALDRSPAGSPRAGRALARLSPACIMHAARARVPRGAVGSAVLLVRGRGAGRRRSRAP